MAVIIPTSANASLQTTITNFFNLSKQLQKLFIDYKKIKTLLPPADVQTALSNMQTAMDNAVAAIKTERASILADPIFKASLTGKTDDEKRVIFNQEMIPVDKVQADILKLLMQDLKKKILAAIDKNQTPEILFPAFVNKIKGTQALSNALSYSYTTPLEDFIIKFNQILSGVTPAVPFTPPVRSAVNERNPLYVTDTIIDYQEAATPFAVKITLDPTDNTTASDKISPYQGAPQIGILKDGYDTPVTTPDVDTSLYSFIPDSLAAVKPLINSLGGYDLYVWGPEFVPAPTGISDLDHLRKCMYFAEVQFGVGSNAIFSMLLRINKGKLTPGTPVKNTKLYLIKSYPTKPSSVNNNYFDATYAKLLNNLALLAP